ncbi:MAG: hypothetical protein U9O78_03505 [Patescibacteria group bacterium]|nr:hypothetical protein [Patescibacteria group bacterium]
MAKVSNIEADIFGGEVNETEKNKEIKITVKRNRALFIKLILH